MILRTMQPGELSAWAAHCGEVFAQRGAAYFERHYRLDPTADPSLVLLAVDGDTIAATLRVFQRTVWIAGEKASIGGIGEVCTKPAYRRQGLAGALLQNAIREMERRAMPISLLFGGQAIYEAAGWRACPAPMKQPTMRSLPALPEGCTLRPFCERDLPAVMALYDGFARALDGAVLRDAVYWRRWVLPQWSAPLVLLRGGSVIAYCSAVRDAQGVLRVHEMGGCECAERPVLLGGLLRRAMEINACEKALVPAALLSGHMETGILLPKAMMARMNIPQKTLPDSDALVRAMGNAWMCMADHF